MFRVILRPSFKVKYQGNISQKKAVTGAVVFHKHTVWIHIYVMTCPGITDHGDAFNPILPEHGSYLYGDRSRSTLHQTTNFQTGPN